MLLRLIRLLFFPISVLYGLIINLRNYQFQTGQKSILAMDPTIISVGNLSTGGTGKTPMIEYLVNLLKEEYSLATLSRGYRRKTKGYRLVNAHDTSETVGDEPVQYFKKFGNEIHVIVSEERVLGVSSLLLDHPEKEVFLLDDAYQHRFLKRDLDILLTSFDQPFYKDWLLPTGNLREPRKEAKRANAIIVTKCPQDLSDEEKTQVKSEIGRYNLSAQVFFSSIAYGEPRTFTSHSLPQQEALLVTGIANPTPLVAHLNKEYKIGKHFKFPDHYQFRNRDLDNLLAYASEHGIHTFFTTEKDIVRLLTLEGHSIFETCTFYYVPIQVTIDKADAFNEMVMKALKGKANL